MHASQIQITPVSNGFLLTVINPHAEPPLKKRRQSVAATPQEAREMLLLAAKEVGESLEVAPASHTVQEGKRTLPPEPKAPEEPTDA